MNTVTVKRSELLERLTLYRLIMNHLCPSSQSKYLFVSVAVASIKTCLVSC